MSFCGELVEFKSDEKTHFVSEVTKEIDWSSPNQFIVTANGFEIPILVNGLVNEMFLEQQIQFSDSGVQSAFLDAVTQYQERFNSGAHKVIIPNIQRVWENKNEILDYLESNGFHYKPVLERNQYGYLTGTILMVSNNHDCEVWIVKRSSVGNACNNDWNNVVDLERNTVTEISKHFRNTQSAASWLPRVTFVYSRRDNCFYYLGLLKGKPGTEPNSVIYRSEEC